MIVRQFRLLIQMKELAGAGVRPAEAARQLHVPTFVAEKLARQARAFSMPQLEAIYRELLALDVAIKSGEREPEIALDTFVAGLA
jgi:DNA polymerase-3 subunit delta